MDRPSSHRVGDSDIGPAAGRRGWAMVLVMALAVGGGLAPRVLHTQSPPGADSAVGTGSLAGTVVDVAGQPLIAVEVTLVQAGITTATDSAGAFTFRDVQPGAYTVRVRRIGYRVGTFDAGVRSGVTIRVRYQIAALGQALDTVRVTGSPDVRGRLRDFEHRRRNAVSGKFFTADDILQFQPNVLTDLLRRATSVQVDDGGDVMRTRKVVSRRGMALESTPQGMQPRPCELRLAVNGTLLPAGTSMNLIAPTDIAGVEVYAGAASIPLEFSQNGTDSFCGLVVVWTK